MSYPRTIIAGLVGTIVALASACGSGEPPARVPAEQASVIFDNLERGQILLTTHCGEMRAAVRPATERAFTAMIRASRPDPDAQLSNPDYPDDPSHRIRDWMQEMADTITTCSETVRPGRGWAELGARLERAAQAPAN